MTANKIPPSELQELLAMPTVTVEEAGRILGLSRPRAYEAVKNKQIPSLRIGRIRIPTAALRKMLDMPAVETAR